MSQRKSSTMFPLIENYLEGSKNADEFCEANKLKKCVLYYWLKKYNKMRTPQPEVSFQPIEITPPIAQNIVVRYPNGTELIIPFSC